MQQYTLYELNEYIRRVVSLNFPDPVWVQCEIFQLSNSRGHYYIQLVQKDGAEDQILARADAVLWQRQYQLLRRDLGPLLDEVLREGLEVLVQVRVTYDERYGLQYHIVQVDPAFSLGKLEIQRQETIRQLKAEGLLEKNAAIPLPPVMQRIAICSSPQAAGLKDFLDQLHQNPYGYRFTTHLFTTAMQGQQVEPEMLARIREIEHQQSRFDCLVVIRGGGSRLDLAAFDQLPLCRGVANCHLPVFSGIGHETDETVLDLVAHTSLKTPTAVAEHLLNHNAAFETRIVQTGNRVGQLVQSTLHVHDQRLAMLGQQLRNYVQLNLQRESQRLEHLGGAMCPARSATSPEPRLCLYHPGRPKHPVHPPTQPRRPCPPPFTGRRSR
ncbi:MAG: exodeoxyribonuclease VII large subunit [Saprospirales bacterium]|nr:exodeoxyribonuclease VII large subunit [Saprospirales bacterium]